jgi:hypothetical protein
LVYHGTLELLQIEKTQRIGVRDGLKSSRVPKITFLGGWAVIIPWRLQHHHLPTPTKKESPIKKTKNCLFLANLLTFN